MMAKRRALRQGIDRESAELEEASWMGCASEQREVIDRGHRVMPKPTLDDYEGYTESDYE